MTKTIFVDVDDTLVRSAGSKQVPMGHVIESVKKLAQAGAEVFLWSSGGADYCRKIAEDYGLASVVRGYLPKPNAYLDDQPIEDWRFLRHVHPGQVDSLVSEWSGEASPEVVVCYRPVGEKELELVRDSGFRAWPPRLPEQPIFYPVTNEEYAISVTRWNVTDFGKGYVTRFSVRKEFLDRYPVKCVGASQHTEWWIPAEDLDAMNRNLVGEIELILEVGKDGVVVRLDRKD